MAKHIITQTVVKISGKYAIFIPRDHSILSVMCRGENIRISAIYDPKESSIYHSLEIVKDGDEIPLSINAPASRKYIGSFYLKQSGQNHVFIIL
jgi:hypothetical protein